MTFDSSSHSFKNKTRTHARTHAPFQNDHTTFKNVKEFFFLCVLITSHTKNDTIWNFSLRVIIINDFSLPLPRALNFHLHPPPSTPPPPESRFPKNNNNDTKGKQPEWTVGVRTYVLAASKRP